VAEASLAGKSDLLLLASVPGEYTFYRFQNVAINVWTGQPTGEAVRCLS
jgi:hypothetical protein